MYYKMSEEELRSTCKVAIENLEKWARLLIDKQMLENFGKDYFNAMENNNYIIKKEIREKAQAMIKKNPNRFTRMIDTLFLDEIIYFLCKENLYKKCFKNCLDLIYPDGRMEAKTFLSRIIPKRNNLAHSNSISIRGAEQVICYSNDFIDGVKEYMKQEGKESEYNVPNILKVADSLGNEFFPSKNNYVEIFNIKERESDELKKFEIGDKYSIYLTLDSSFSIEQYNFKWYIGGEKIKTSKINDTKIVLTFGIKHVAEEQFIKCKLISSNQWHKYGYYDQEIMLTFKVLPPKN